ncbi:conserved hypothetical protein [Trichinella spiralis]|uniref:hypothetical protein n=1 Tax=Trichinella spiralis TaxID=6334 RepID=UPI0001EFB5E3|nr:conserved hypothetical protein [Trichinella spiralis]
MKAQVQSGKKRGQRMDRQVRKKPTDIRHDGLCLSRQEEIRLICGESIGNRLDAISPNVQIVLPKGKKEKENHTHKKHTYAVYGTVCISFGMKIEYCLKTWDSNVVAAEATTMTKMRQVAKAGKLS